jgi:phosphatidate cytidylyltransferase
LAPDTTPAQPEQPKPGPSNLQLRTIYGLLGAAALVGSVWFSPWTFGLFFAFVQAVMLWEFYRMMRAGGYAPASGWGLGVGLIVYSVAFYAISANAEFRGNEDDTLGGFAAVLVRPAFALVILLPVILLIRELKEWSDNKSTLNNPFANIGITFLGLIYVTMPMTFLSVIAFDKENGYDYRRVIVLLFLIWASDIGAYAAGKTFGKHKLAPKISPGKTWEGFAGGVVLTLAMGWALGYLIPELPLAHRLVAAGVVAVFGPLGDLAESMLKRSVGVKDSGSIMPGHGGLLDRFDAFLLVLPVLVLLQLLVG